MNYDKPSLMNSRRLFGGPCQPNNSNGQYCLKIAASMREKTIICNSEHKVISSPSSYSSVIISTFTF